jgi:signal transduction histidine kinase
VSVQVSLDRDLPATVEATLYRIAQEALTNAARHAKASQAHVVLKQAGHSVACSIRDDGIGIDLAAVAPGRGGRGMGLVEIDERVAALGGALHISAGAPCGTKLTVEIPLEN